MHRSKRGIRARFRYLPLIATLAAGIAGAPGAAAAPGILVTPDTAAPGGTITLVGSGFTPGGYSALVLFDGAEVERFFIPVGGSFSRPFTVPPGAPPGPHEVAVCAAIPGEGCSTLDFEQRDSDELVVGGSAPPPASFDVLVRAVEVTQGLRTAIPARPSRGTGGFGVSDPFQHVAGRRTIVRVHPWIFVESEGSIPPLTARLLLFSRSDSPSPPSEPPVSPVNSFVLIDPNDTLEDTRSDASRSWNFVLPESWTAEGESGLVVLVNPPGQAQQVECAGCEGNNFFGIDVSFSRIQTRDIAVKIYSTELFWRDSFGRAQSLAPLATDIADTVSWWLKTSPIDPGVITYQWLFRRMAWDYVADAPVAPPVPGVQSALAVQGQIDSQNTGAQQFYTFLPLLLNHRTHPSPPPGGTNPIGCQGAAAVGGVPKNFLTATCGPVYAQEATHTLGYNHACNQAPCPHGDETGGGWDPNYPNRHGAVEADAFGFDVWNMSVIPPGSGASHTHDFMSYGGAPKWVSMFTWQNVASAFSSVPAPASSAARAAAAPGGSTFLEISGSVLADDSVRFDPAFHVTLPDGVDPPQDDPTGEYLLRLEDSRHRTLFEHRFHAVPHTAHGFGDEGFPRAVFSALVPPVVDIQRVILTRGMTELARVSVSSSAPQVSLAGTDPSGPWPAQGSVEIGWEASDPDGGPLHFRLEAGRDGAGWRILGGTTGQTRLQLDLAALPLGAGDWDLRIQASDGLRVSEETFGPVAVEPRPPRALVLAPGHRKVVTAARDVGLLGAGIDLQDPALPDSSMAWSLDGQTVGSGREIDLPFVQPGTHTASLTVTNSHGLSDTMSVQFIVDTAVPDPDLDSDLDGLVDAVEWMVYMTYPLIADSDGDLLDDGMEVELGTDPRHPDSDGDGLPDGGEIRWGSDPLAPDGDADGDGVADAVDNCPATANPEQRDLDLDGAGDACDPDGDGDQIPDESDLCPGTAPGAVVSPLGCSVQQLCPCDAGPAAPSSGGPHGRYVSCVAHAAGRLSGAGIIDPAERARLVREAARSECGLGEPPPGLQRGRRLPGDLRRHGLAAGERP